MFTTMSTHTSYLTTVLPTWILLGLGLGLVTPSTTNTVMSGTLPHDRGITAAFRTTSQQVDGSIGLALANTIAAGAIVSYVADHGSDGSEEAANQALVHGTSVAATWSSALLAVGTAVVFLLINHKPESCYPAEDGHGPADRPRRKPGRQGQCRRRRFVRVRCTQSRLVPPVWPRFMGGRS